ncbi:MAG: type II toxin-antitoxin system HicB family antitoxin [Deltaproteobacteria bacterium]|nr:type II toxin-antitoxin system HicB family antitoxin [Deltaproteobacteria bacterium]
MAYYVALLFKDEDSDYGAKFPDVPGCYAAGSSLDEVSRNAAEALRLHLEVLANEGREIPKPSKLEAIMAAARSDPDDSGAVPFLVEIPDQVRFKKVTITVPEDALAKIDSYASRRGKSRSAFLVEAAEKAIEA